MVGYTIVTISANLYVPWQDNPTSSEWEQVLVDFGQLKRDVSEPEQ